MQFRVKGLGLISDEHKDDFTGIELLNASTGAKPLYIRSKFADIINKRYDAELNSKSPLIRYVDSGETAISDLIYLSLYRRGLIYKKMTFDGHAASVMANMFTSILLVLSFIRTSMDKFPLMTVLHCKNRAYTRDTDFLYVEPLDFNSLDNLMLDKTDIIVAMSQDYSRCRLLSDKWVLEGKPGLKDNKLYILNDDGRLYSIDVAGRYFRVELSLIEPAEFMADAQLIGGR